MDEKITPITKKKSRINKLIIIFACMVLVIGLVVWRVKRIISPTPSTLPAVAVVCQQYPSINCQADEVAVPGGQNSSGCSTAPRCQKICAKAGENLQDPNLDTADLVNGARATICCSGLQPSISLKLGVAATCQTQPKVDCPEYAPPGPDFCSDGKVIAPKKNDKGCYGPPSCQLACAKASENIQNPKLAPDSLINKGKPLSCCSGLVATTTKSVSGEILAEGTLVCQSAVTCKSTAPVICKAGESAVLSGSDANGCKLPEVCQTFCGGIQGKACPEGFSCKLDGDYPDASGNCVAKPCAKEGESLQDPSLANTQGNNDKPTACCAGLTLTQPKTASSTPLIGAVATCQKPLN